MARSVKRINLKADDLWGVLAWMTPPRQVKAEFSNFYFIFSRELQLTDLYIGVPESFLYQRTR